MKAQLRIYSTSQQTKKIGEDGKFLSKKTADKYSGKTETITTQAERTIYTVEHEVKSNLSMGKKYAQLEYFVTNVIGARVKAALSVDKRVPANLYFEIKVGGVVFRSETALTKANFTSLIKLSMKNLGLMKPEEIIASVANTQQRAIRASIGFLKDVATIAKESDKIGVAFKDSAFLVEGEDGMSVSVEPVDESVDEPIA